MKRLLAMTALGMTLAACGSVADLKPQAGKSLPGEFREALDAYNRGLEKISE